MTTTESNHVGQARLRATLLTEDYASLTENPSARMFFSEIIADLLVEAHFQGQESVTVLQRALRIMGRDFQVSNEVRQRLDVPADHPPERTRAATSAATADDPAWEEPPPKWEEPTASGTRKRGRFGRWEAAMRADPGRFLVYAENVSSGYAAQQTKQHPGFEFVEERQRRNDKRSYKVWARYLGEPAERKARTEAS
jgi:hypothetical protein